MRRVPAASPLALLLTALVTVPLTVLLTVLVTGLVGGCVRSGAATGPPWPTGPTGHPGPTGPTGHPGPTVPTVPTVPPARPALAPAPAPPLSTPLVTFTRTGRTGLVQRLVIRPDGEWIFLPAPGSARAGVLHDGRLDPDRHAELARLLSGADLPAQLAAAGVESGECPAGAGYRLTAGALDAGWSECAAAGHPALTALLDLLTSVAPV